MSTAVLVLTGALVARAMSIGIAQPAGTNSGFPSLADTAAQVQ